MRINILKLVTILLIVSGLSNSQEIRWRKKQNLPKAYRNGSAVAYNGKIYFMGGYCDATPERFEKSNYEYDPTADRWVSKADLPTGRSNFALTVAGNKIYAIGGDPFSSGNEVYNPATDSWDTLKPMITPRQHISCAVVNGKIYIAGGLKDVKGYSAPSAWSYRNITNENEVYDPSTNTWKELTPMPTKRHGAYMTAVEGKIYVIGGMGDEKDIWKSLSVVEMYDPETDKWETKNSLPEPGDGFGISVIDNKIFVVGGFSINGIVNTVFVYAPEDDKWSTSTKFPNVENGSAGCASINNKIYIIGGCNKNYSANSNLFEGEVINENLINDYFDQTPPGGVPKVFAPGTISINNKNSHALVFSHDGNMIIFSRYPDKTSYIIKKENNKWTEPVESFFYGKEVSFSPDGKKIFYYTGGDIFYVEKNPAGWNKPVRLGTNINTDNLIEFYPCIVKTGDLYFSSDGNWSTSKVMVSKYQNGEFQKGVDLGLPINNGGALHAWVSPDESYMLFNSPRKGSFTKLDIWISFHKENGEWAGPVNLGKNINSGADAILCPTVSPDGKYMFFTKLNFNTNTGLIYWVKSDLIDSLKSMEFND